jgi:hypothetical protein
MKDGRNIARLHDPEWLDLFWRRPILTPIEPTPEGVNLFDDAYWWDCTYQVRHVTLDLEAPHAIIQIAGDPPRVLVRGIPEAIPEENWPMNRTTK